MEKELDEIQKQIKSRKTVGLDGTPPEVGKTRIFDEMHLRLCNAAYKQNTREEMIKGYILQFLNKSALGITKNNSGILRVV